MTNDKWTRAQILCNECSPNSAFVNKIKRKAQTTQDEIDLIRSKLRNAEKSGFTDSSREDIMKEFKNDLSNNK